MKQQRHLFRVHGTHSRSSGVTDRVEPNHDQGNRSGRQNVHDINTPT